MSNFQKSVIVTGAGSGMGAATAKRLVNEGWSVTLFGRTLSKLEKIAAEIAQPNQTHIVQGDVSNRESVASLINSHIEKFSRLDGLVNSAGVAIGGAIDQVAPEDWKQVMSINVEGVFNTISLATPHLRKVGGAIVNVSSVSGLGGDWGFSPYNASKGALSNFTRALALELGAQGMRINAVAPTLTDTDMGSFLTENEEMMALFKSRNPMGRAAKPEEVASAISFLLSDDASFINGVNLPIDGGTSASNGQPNFLG